MARRSTLLPHLVVAGGVLVALACWVHAAGQVSMDEGVAVVQARALADGAWSVDHPLEPVDTSGATFPLRDAERTGDGYLPFAKHPAYPALLSLADRVGRTTGMVGLSLVGTLAAAAAAAALARRLDERLAVPTLYVVALGSPLLFDSTLVIAHALGAAAAGTAAVAIVRHHESGRASSAWLGVSGATVAATVLLRSEGMLLALAATAVVGALAVRTPSRARAAVAGGIAGGSAGGFLADRLWSSAVVGRGIEVQRVVPETVSWWQARVDALATTTLQAGYGGDRATPILLGGIGLLVVVTVALRVGGPASRLARLAAVAAAVLLVLWSATVAPSPVPGLVLAFPVLWMGLLAGRWTDVPLARALATVSGLFALAVAATQYRQGGGYEWGARYVAITLPLVVPVVLLGLLRALDGVDRATAWAVGASLTVVSLALGTVAVAAKRDAGVGAERLGRAIIAAAPSSEIGPGDDGRPVVVSAEFVVPQAITGVYDDARWLQLYELDAQGEGRAVRAMGRLLEAGIDRFMFVTLDPDGDRELLAGTREVTRRQVGLWSLLVLEPAATP